MAITNTVMLYAVLVSLFGFALASLAVWSRRDFRMRLLAVGLAVAMAPVMWFAFDELPGQARAMSAKEFRKKYLCATIMHSEIRDKKGIFMLAKHDDEKDFLYVFVTWDLKLVGSLQKAKRIAAVNRKGTIVYGGASCAGDGDEEGEEGNGKGKKSKGKKGKKSEGAVQPGSSGQEQDAGDEFTFHPDPVPPNPEKDYSPTYETPIVMPERR